MRLKKRQKQTEMKWFTDSITTIDKRIFHSFFVSLFGHRLVRRQILFLCRHLCTWIFSFVCKINLQQTIVRPKLLHHFVILRFVGDLLFLFFGFDSKLMCACNSKSERNEETFHLNDNRLEFDCLSARRHADENVSLNFVVNVHRTYVRRSVEQRARFQTIDRKTKLDGIKIQLLQMLFFFWHLSVDYSFFFLFATDDRSTEKMVVFYAIVATSESR